MFIEVFELNFFPTGPILIGTGTLDYPLRTYIFMHEYLSQQCLLFAGNELAPVLDLVVEGGGEAAEVPLPQLLPASGTLVLHFAAAVAADEVAGGAAWDGQLPRHHEAGAALEAVLHLPHPPLQTLIVFRHYYIDIATSIVIMSFIFMTSIIFVVAGGPSTFAGVCLVHFPACAFVSVPDPATVPGEHAAHVVIYQLGKP